MLAITTAVLIGTVILLSGLCVKLLSILIGALLLYFCPILFLLFAGAAAIYFRFTRRGKARARRMMGTFGDRDRGN